ncbi:MAG: aldo/keto reductase [Clostridia bacterium]|nr:aldo/keto reductase [Clostridia bacterium]
MIYSNVGGCSVSLLGMGTMRLPTDSTGEIDKAATREMIAYAMKSGINYFDTAWGYHGGKSESVMGELLSEYPRDSYCLVSKFPGYDPANLERHAEVFEEQLRKCRTDYFDFYLFHTVSETNIDNYLDPKYGLFDYLCEQKRNGRIRHLGFSVHASLETMERFLDAYGDELEFGQVQLNYLDWNFQDAKSKVKVLRERGLPVIVMEPVRGGALCSLSDRHIERLRALDPTRTPAEWAFRFVQSIDGVAVVLSGMSNFEQLRENVETFGTRTPLTEEEFNTLLEIGREMTAVGTLPCTSCRYCVEYCPQGLNIPWIIGLYNDKIYEKETLSMPRVLLATPADKRPSACLSCRACEEVCPQGIRISEMMKRFAEAGKA